MIRQHLKKVMVVKSFATISILEKGPVDMVPNVGLSTRIDLEEEKEREDSATSNKS
jgi:hypothetical protein